jgi:hypothetical protein
MNAMRALDAGGEDVLAEITGTIGRVIFAASTRPVTFAV